MIKYILTFFIAFFTLNALEIEAVENFAQENEGALDIIETIDIESNNPVVYQKITKKVTKHKVETNRSRIVKKEKKAEINKKKKSVIKKDIKSKKTPQLAIIIDDISRKSQIDFLKKLPYHITPSVFPPTKMNMNSNKLVKNLKHYMVHLPIESHSKAMNKIYKMLFLKDSNSKIRKRVKEIKKLFPKAKYINNHTGSLFSANYKKSKVLYKAIIDAGFIFLDSRTTKKTKFKQIAKEMNRKYYRSDIYLDNVHSVKYTINQLKKAVNLAKKRGYAVVIGHPHPTTFKALKKAKSLFKDIKMVYIDELKF